MPDPPRHTAALIEYIRNELKCVSCGYEFRGLEGEFITCPECGRKHNIANMVAHAWRGRWYQAPGFNLLALPLAAPIAWCVLVGAMAVIFDAWFMTGQMERAVWIVSIATFVAWIVLIVIVVRRYRRWVGLMLTLLIQIIFPIYFIGIFSLFVVGIFFYAHYQGEDPPILVPVGSFAVAIACFVSAWAIQRLFARQCIRVHIRKLADEGTIAA